MAFASATTVINSKRCRNLSINFDGNCCPSFNQVTIIKASFSSKNNNNNNNNNNNSNNNNNNIHKFFRKQPNNNNNNSNNNFEEFDGSRPLLPPWRPETLEQDFTYVSSRIISREIGLKKEEEKQKNELISIQIKINEQSTQTMFASLIQYVNHDKNENRKVWLRPLLLVEDQNDAFIDLRGYTSDVLLDQHLINNDKNNNGNNNEIDHLTKMKVRLNLAVTEPDVIDRSINQSNDYNDDGNDVSAQIASKALLQFLSSLHQNHDNNQ